jgi:hypothetical protein
MIPYTKSIVIKPFKNKLKQKYRLCRKTAQKLWNFAAQTHKTCMMNNLIQLDQETGLTINRNYMLNSGFNAVEGVRQFGQLTIKEGVLKGVASNL